MTKSIVTNHAKQRGKDRLGINKKAVDRIADKALEYGLRHLETQGNLKTYIDKLYLSHKNANNIRIHNRQVFLFRDNVLITILNLPKNLVKIADKLKKRLNR